MSEYSSLSRGLAEALIDVVWFVESCDDEQMDPDDAVKVLEGVAHRLGGLADDQRDEFLGVVAAIAQAEPGAERRDFIESLPDAFGLLDHGV
ncbi:hypothetical protein [Yinghuangia sp. YIM S09857]|uniref:hypothetical protein n=1 Tax=Yinghuangia sp. YIM S09857 TaxID=3436929 RepID=UPI003F52C3A6